MRSFKRRACYRERKGDHDETSIDRASHGVTDGRCCGGQRRWHDVSECGPQISQSASDTLNLTIKQQNTAWNDLRSHAAEQKAPSGFHAFVGSTVPSTVKIEQIPGKAASNVPSLKPYDFAMIRGKLLIVNPSDRKVAAVMSDVTGS